MSHHDRERMKLLQRVRKMRGQLDAVEKSLGVDEDCGQVTLLYLDEFFNDPWRPIR